MSLWLMSYRRSSGAEAEFIRFKPTEVERSRDRILILLFEN